jgi:hypothetical protein
MKTFGELFTKYRLRAEFVSLTTFADALAQKGYFYEISLFCHWQKGRRIPTKRAIVLALIAVFIDRRAIHTLQEANEFLESAGHGYLTDAEQMGLFSFKHVTNPQIF